VTFDEMVTTVEALLDEGESAAANGNELLPLVPDNDIIVDELWGLFMASADEFDEIRRSSRNFDEIVAAAAKTRDTTLAWLRYIEAVIAASDKSIPGDLNAVYEDLAKKGYVVDSGRRRKNRAGKEEIVWVMRPAKDNHTGT
jgi:hypothetical protein